MQHELSAAFGRTRLLYLIAGSIIGVLLLTPLAIVVPTSWTGGQLLEFPPRGFSLQWYEAAVTDPKWTDPFLVSLRISLQASVVATVVGTLAAFGIRAAARGTRFARSLFILPLAIPYVSYALGIYQAFLRLPEPIATSTLPLVLAQATITFPLAYVIVSGALATVDHSLSRAAATMGARWPMIIWKVELPLVRPAILGAWIFAFATCFDEATLALFLAPLDQTTLAQRLYREASESIAPTLSAVSVMITTFALVVLALSTFITSRVSARRSKSRLEGVAA